MASWLEVPSSSGLSVPQSVHILTEIPDDLRREVAEIYTTAFAAKILPIARSAEAAVAVVDADLDAARGILAVDGQRVLGVAGLNYGGRRMVQPTLRSFVDQFGWLGGSCCGP